MSLPTPWQREPPLLSKIQNWTRSVYTNPSKTCTLRILARGISIPGSSSTPLQISRDSRILKPYEKDVANTLALTLFLFEKRVDSLNRNERHWLKYFHRLSIWLLIVLPPIIDSYSKLEYRSRVKWSYMILSLRERVINSDILPFESL